MKSNQPTDFFNHVIATDGCWYWKGARSGPRYGSFNIAGKKVKAHRFSWELVNGKIPMGMVVMHSCDNGMCVNPDHLSLGTQKDNALDRENKGRGNQPAGSAVAASKLTEQEVTEIRALYTSGSTQVALAQRFGVVQTTISKIILRKQWQHI